MIARDAGLRRHPAAFRALTGLTVSQFDALWVEVAVIVDTFEPRIERPTDPATADTYDSGKKKQHTLEVQVAVDEGGGIVDVPPSIRGPTNDPELLRMSGLPDRLGPEVGILGGLAYVGIKASHPTGARPDDPARRGGGRLAPSPIAQSLQ